MSDLISRQEAIQAITKDMEELAVTSLPQRDAGIRMGMEISKHIIGEIPSARPTGDLISRKEAIEAIMSEPMSEPRYPAWWADKIKELPSARPTGEWLFIDDGYAEHWECDQCGEMMNTLRGPGSFCPNCGCAMEREE